MLFRLRVRLPTARDENCSNAVLVHTRALISCCAVAQAQHLGRNCHFPQHSPKAMCGLPQHGVLGPQHSGAAGAVIVAALYSPKAKAKIGVLFFVFAVCVKKIGALFCLRVRRRKKIGPLFCLRHSRRKKIGALNCLRRRRIDFSFYFFHMICRGNIVHYFYDRSVRFHPVWTLLQTTQHIH